MPTMQRASQAPAGLSVAVVMLLAQLLVLLQSHCHAARIVQPASTMHSTPRGVFATTAAAQADAVDALPGWDAPLTSAMYAGYVSVDDAAQRELFYIMVESTRSPASDPLVLWLNGGPGCSSLGGGFLSELGPYLPLPGGKTLQANPYAWNRVANVLFVESPAFVGFSKSADPADRVVGDARTAKDMREFLLRLMDRFPGLAGNALYVSGESYAGHYAPQLAWEIVQGNQAAQQQQQQQHQQNNQAATAGDSPAGYLNLKGVLVGNPWTDTEIDNKGAVDYWWAHALISDESAEGIRQHCNFSHIGPLLMKAPRAVATNQLQQSDACDRFCDMAQAELTGINIYEIFAPLCVKERASAQILNFAHALGLSMEDVHAASLISGVSDGSTTATASAWGAAAARGRGAATEATARGQHSTSKARLGLSVAVSGGFKDMNEEDDGDIGGPPEPAYDPCVDFEVETYFNLPDVQRALHANVSGDVPGPWTDCTRAITYSRRDLLTSVLPTWNHLVQQEGLRFLVYSGDVDGIVPVVGTRRWVAGLGLQQASPWRPWSSGPERQVGGYVVEYSTSAPAGAAAKQAAGGGVARVSGGVAAQQSAEAAADPGQQGTLVFATVRGAGHMVPYVQPQRALHLFAHFLAGARL